MEKKAEIARDHVILFAVAMFVFVIVIIFLFGPGKQVIIDTYKILFPKFGNSTTGPEDIQVIRYDILTDKIEFYDGLDWISFENQPSVRLGDIEIEYQKNSKCIKY